MTRAVLVATDPPYEVRVGRGILGEVTAAVADRSALALISDERVAGLHAGDLTGLAGVPLYRVAPGEGAKSLDVLEQVLEFLAAAELDRRSCVVLLGGGVVGDLGALAASLFMRGIDYVACPTTLLAQVDASVGGKTAINLAAGKNLAGTFHQPRGVWADVDTLATLDARDYASGLGEVVKTALIAGEEMLDLVESSSAALRARDPDSLEEVVAGCVRTKAGVVARDPREAGPRKALNLGHTFAHAIEHAAGYGRIAHGAAVAVGLMLALEYARRAGLLAAPELVERTRALLGRLDLPAGLAALRSASGEALAPSALLAGMRHDKKGPAGCARLVLARAPGDLALDVEADPRLLRELLG